MEQEFVELLKCPISKKIFNTPILSCSDGITYEDQLCNDENKIVCVALKSFISEFLYKFPEYKVHQYQPIIQNISHNIAKTMVNNIIVSSNFEKLKGYCNFSLSYIAKEILEKLLTKANDEIIIYFIENLANISEQLDGCNLLHYICRYCPNKLNIIQKAIEKGISVKEFNPTNKFYPLHYLMRYSNNTECIIFVLNHHITNDLSLFTTNSDGHDIIGYAFRYGSVDVISHIFTMINTQQKEFTDNIDTYIEFINNNELILENNDQKELFIGLLFG